MDKISKLYSTAHTIQTHPAPPPNLVTLSKPYNPTLSHDLMASACVNNNVNTNFFDSPGSYDWFNPRSSKSVETKPTSPTVSPEKPSENLLDLDIEFSGTGDDFEFRLEDPVNMLPADELFLNGQLMPLHISTSSRTSCNEEIIKSASVEEILKSKVLDPYLFSPKAPRCSSGWRELLGLKKLQNNNSSNDQKSLSASKTASSKPTCSSSSLKHFMHRNPKPADSSLALPLLKEPQSHPEDDLPRASLDSHKSSSSTCPNPRRGHPPKVRLVRRAGESNNTNVVTPATVSASASAMGVSIDSPRMNSSGKVVFQSLERSSSSPSTFNGGPRVKYKGMERRSYSANVKVSPVLNVPVCSLRGSSKFGLGQLFPSPHKTRGGGSSTSTNGSSELSSERSRSHHSNKQKPSS